MGGAKLPGLPGSGREELRRGQLRDHPGNRSATIGDDMQQQELLPVAGDHASQAVSGAHLSQLRASPRHMAQNRRQRGVLDRCFVTGRINIRTGKTGCRQRLSDVCRPGHC